MPHTNKWTASCGTCAFFVGGADGLKNPFGYCHRYPPRKQKLPIVRAMSWCGEFINRNPLENPSEDVSHDDDGRA